MLCVSELKERVLIGRLMGGSQTVLLLPPLLCDEGTSQPWVARRPQGRAI